MSDVFEFRYYRDDKHHYRVDPARDDVRVSVDGLWIRPNDAIKADDLAYAHVLGHATEIPVDAVPCHLCMVVAGTVTREIVHEWNDALVIVPRPSPVVDGHLLVVPRQHVQDALADPALSAQMFFRATTYAAEHVFEAMNIATSRGKAATQTEPHLHIHLVPRKPGDGLPFLWDRGASSPLRPAQSFFPNQER